VGETRRLRRLLKEAGIEEKCAQCGRIQELEVDHISMNHLNDSVDNLRYLCRPCHLARHYPNRKWEPKDFSPCPLCGKLALCGWSVVRGQYTCPKCFRCEFKKAHGVLGRLPEELLYEYSLDYACFLNSTPRYKEIK